MKKLSCNTFKGINYIHLSSLPAVQAESLKQTLNERTLIKILKEDVVLNDCVLYTAYSKWFDTYSIEISALINLNQEVKLKKQVTVA